MSTQEKPNESWKFAERGVSYKQVPNTEIKETEDISGRENKMFHSRSEEKANTLREHQDIQ